MRFEFSENLNGLLRNSLTLETPDFARQIARRLLGSIVALAALPLYVAVRGVPGALEVLVFAWLVLPMLTAYYLSRTGRYESAHVLSSFALTALVTVVAAGTGGIGSFAAIW